MGTLAVAEPEKKSPDADAKKKYSASVKLRPVFKEQLAQVAKDLGFYPGELIEERMAAFIAAEYKRILKAKLKRVEGGESG